MKFNIKQLPKLDIEETLKQIDFNENGIEII